MKPIQLKVTEHQMLADTLTPVGIYLNIRDRYPGSVLLESSDYSSKENSLSFIAFDTLAEIKFEDNVYSFESPQGTTSVTQNPDVPDLIQGSLSNFEIHSEEQISFDPLAFYGYNTFESVALFDDISFNDQKQGEEIPMLHYKMFRYQLVIDHFRNQMTIIEAIPETETSQLEKIVTLVSKTASGTFGFSLKGAETVDMPDEFYLDIVNKGIQHCQLGDVFQIVLSRRFEQQFAGDEFNVYRALRSINPSPYLFFFDFENFKLFGSSPEAQLKVQQGKAEIHPIAGTYKRTGDIQKDQELAVELLNDPKENAEHTMLVDLARNDLSRSAKNVAVASLRETQFFSHVIHLTSKVVGDVKSNAYRTFADTFPAGTLSGAPKYKALQLIDGYEKTKRGFYGGSVGIISASGTINKAILIRSFLSKNNTLIYQAGAGIVAKSDPGSELQEVNNKIAALRKALKLAETV